MMNKTGFSQIARQYVMMSNPQSKLLTSVMCRAFYYPDANHHHLNQEVSISQIYSQGKDLPTTLFNDFIMR